ncbi:MAG: Reeler domain-containing protein [Lysobacterales bacterium]
MNLLAFRALKFTLWTRRAVVNATLLGAALASQQVGAFSQGSPICQVNNLPLQEMATTLASPPPTGWTLAVDGNGYRAGRPAVVRVRNADPLRMVRGVLLWALSGAGVGAGQFELPPSGNFQFVPAPANCGEWAISHTHATVKDQAELVFLWNPPSSGNGSGSVIMRAFVIEDCAPAQDCRSWQALTPILGLSLIPVVFADGFE